MAPSDTANFSKKKVRQEHAETLEKLLQFAKSKADEMDALSNAVQSEHDNAMELIDEFKNTYTEEKQNCIALIAEIKTSKSQAGNLFREIDELHTKIFGVDVTEGDDDEDDAESGSGLKYDLENAYHEINEGFEALSKAFVRFQEEKVAEFSKVLQEHSQRFEDTQKRIDGLLPGALSAGLSSAFQKKRMAIEATQKWHYVGFIASIIALSLMFGITFWTTMNTSSFDTFFFFVCRNLLVASPIFWLAIFLNRRLNLDTRLIEE